MDGKIASDVKCATLRYRRFFGRSVQGGDPRFLHLLYCHCYLRDIPRTPCCRSIVQGIPSLGRRGCSGQLTTQEVANCARNFLGMCLQCKVAGVVEIHFGTRVVTPEGLGARRQKERVALSPYREQRADDK